MIERVHVEMFGGLTVWADDTPILDGATKINKPWQVFCFLVLNRQTPVSAARLISVLWPDESLADPANVLKNTVYALRREFKAAKSTKESPILFENGGYMCNPNIEYVVDVESFERISRHAAGAEGDEKLNLLGQAVEMYRGELLPQIESEVWVMPLALYYRQLYNDDVAGLCEGLEDQGRYNELLAAATAANRIDPLEESHYLYMFRALYALEMYRAIIPAYHKTVRIFSEELGTSLCQEIQDIYQDASEQIDSIEQDIMIIKDELREVVGAPTSLSGPLYCTYDVFKYLYQMVARSAERGGGSVMIVLLTLADREGEHTPAKIMSAAMNQVKNLILGGLLRKSDTVARYSKSQYIIMLSIDKAASAQLIINRIKSRCEGFLAPMGIEMVFANTEMDPFK